MQLVSAAAWLVDGDHEAATANADAALLPAARLAVVREAVGLVHYRVGDFGRALRELRAARRMGAGPELLPVIVDCERALGRPERALELATGPEASGLDRAAEVELAIVVAGLRSDLGDGAAALRGLQELRELRSSAPAWSRLLYAYADLLLAAGREEEARECFGRVVRVDVAGDTDAADRVLAMDGLVVDELEVDDPDVDEPEVDELEVGELEVGRSGAAVDDPGVVTDARVPGHAGTSDGGAELGEPGADRSRPAGQPGPGGHGGHGPDQQSGE